MIGIILPIVLLLLSLSAMVLRKTYAVVPPKEMKRQARQGDELAKILYRAVAYNSTLSALLWIIIILAAASGFVLLSLAAPAGIALIVVALVVAYDFAWLPTTDVSPSGVRLAVWSTPSIVWLLAHLQPVLRWLVQKLGKYHVTAIHTGLFERSDLVDLLRAQHKQSDNRILPEELQLAAHALNYGQKKVADVLTAKRDIRVVNVEDALGPIVMDELHESGLGCFPVYEGKKDNIVGTLYLRDLVNAKKGGHIRDIMDHMVYYVHEDHSLDQVLDAFIKTKRHMFVVVNNFEEYVGVVTIEDILSQIIGRQITDDFDGYEDRHAVANHLHVKEQPQPAEAVVTAVAPETPEESTEKSA